MTSTPKPPVTFEHIKSYLSTFNRDSITELILTQLHYVQVNDDKAYPIWLLFALLKWNHLYSSDKASMPDIDTSSFNELLLLTQRFETQYAQVSFKRSDLITRSLLITAYQQEIINQHYYTGAINRQIVLFSRISTRLDVSAAFETATGINLLRFFNYCSFTYLYLNRYKIGDGFPRDGVLYEDDYRQLFTSAYGIAQLDRFLDLVTLSSVDQFSQLHKLGDEQLQLFETNFFLTKPFLLFRGFYINPHNAIFIQTIHYFVYTYMKAALPDRFAEDFGKRMEMYVGMGLKEAGVPFIGEDTIKKRYALKKVVDYLVADDILVECKATELHPRSGILRLPNMMTNELNSSIVKAYIQMLATATAADPHREWFGIVVTYREMYLAHGAYAWDEFLAVPATEWAAREGLDVALLPPKNLFFISLEYWDYMMQVIKNGKTGLKDILLKTRDCCHDPDPVNRTLLMDMVLMKHFKIDTMNLSYLADAQESVDFTERMHD